MNNIIPAADDAEASAAASEDMGGDNGSREEGGDIIELGDRVRIETANYGVLEGRVYYRHPTDLIRVMPDGVSNRVFDFPLDDGEFTEDIGVSSATILEKHRIEGFAAQQDLRPGLLMDTFDADGRLAATYTIQGVNEETDTVTVLLDGAEEQFNFDFIGIPRDAPFVALGTREPPVEDEATPAASPEEVAEAAAAAAPGPLDAEEAEEAFEDGDDEEDFVVVGKMVLPTFIEAEEIPSSEQIYPAHVQKSDALNGFLELMTDSMKKDPRMLRRARALTEMFAGLKNEFLVYDKSGRPIGANPTHMETLHDLFRAVPVPLGRPVLSVAKRFYKDPIADEDKTVEQEAAAAAAAGAGYDEIESYMRHIMRINSTKSATEIDAVMKNAIIRDFIEELVAEIRDNKGSTTGVGAGAGGSTRGQTGSMQYWIWLQAHMHEFLRPWYAADTDGELWDSKADSEFFREEFPDFDDPKVVTMESRIKVKRFAIESVSQSFVEKPFAIARALGPTFRTDEKKARRLLKAAEAAPLRGYVLFPLLFAPNMGAIRTGMLARDVEYSMRKYMTMSAILQSMGGVSDVPTSNGILALGVDGNTLGNIPVADYLNGIAFSGLGMGSFDLILRQFGLNQFEISMEMNEVLQRKLAATQNSLRVHIDSLRSALEEYVSNVPTVVNNSLFGAPALAAGEEAEAEGAGAAAATQPLPLEAARVEPMLERIMREAAAMSPSLSANDIALTAALMARNQDLFTAIASGQPAVVAMERLRAQRAAYAKALESAKAIRELTIMKGEAPKANTCKHVTLLRDIRREGDDIKRMQLMTKFVATYSGARDGNWINCKACKEHLICMHELLQLKMFHQPREKQAIQKELLLNFNGPLVGGKYQCRNCGQPIADLDFDKHLEFDDEGRPMMGAAPMDTTEADWEAQKQQALDLEIKKEAPIKYENDNQQEIYEVVKVLADTTGVPLKKEGYDRIIAGVQGFIAKRESRETYAKHIERLRKKNPAEAARMPSYDMRLSRFLIGAVAAYLLIEVQSSIPNYVIRFWIPGCKPGFSGYPIGNPENFTGVEYVSCAVSTIRSSPPPATASSSDEIPRRSHWETTAWQKIPSDKDRIQQISDLIKQILEKHAVADPGVQAALNAKRQYNQETLGAAAAAETEGDVITDTIPVGFLPTQMVMTPEEAAAAPVIAEAASPDALAALHVMAAHKYARLNGNLVVGSPFAETVCCTVPVNRPQLFWEQQTELPPLPVRAIRAGYSGSRLVQHFSPRRQAEISLQSPQHLYYRVFLNVCYTGPNIGRPHELGFTNKCSQCGFQFPASLFAVKDYIETTGLSGGEAKKEKARRADELREAERQATSLFAEAGVTINAETFQEVLDAAHRNNVVDPYMLPPVMSGLDRVGALAELDPLPAPNWIGILEDLVQQLVGLPARAELSDKALAMGTLSNEIEAAKEALLIHMESLRARDEAEAICETIERMDPFSFMEMLQAYVITPGQRLLTSIDAKAVVNYQLGGYVGLADSHMTLLRSKVMEPAWRVQHAMLKYFNSPKTVLAQLKLQYAIQQFMTVYAQCKRLNAGNVPGGEYVLKYIYHYFFYVILAAMLDGNIIPPIATEQAISTFDVSTPILIETLLVMLRQIRREQVSMSPEQIKEAIKIRTEKENEYFVHRMETRTDDEKAVTMIMKGLKMGEWAVSAAQVQKYDADRFEVERLERMAMGVVDFTEDGVPTVSAELETLFNYGDEMVYTAAEGDGYDNAQFREDDF